MLKVSHICKTFTGGIIRKTRVDAVKDVSFTICNGETFGIVGNSGCAKKIGYSLEEPMIIHKMYDKAGRKKRVKELLDLVDLGEELLDRYPHQISGGEAQRIMIARALSLDPKILILDEPTSMLDVSVQAQVMTLLKELQEKLGLSYLFISHDLDVVRWFCDEIAVMEEGKFVETGRTEDVIGHPKAEFTKKLVESFILE